MIWLLVLSASALLAPQVSAVPTTAPTLVPTRLVVPECEAWCADLFAESQTGATYEAACVEYCTVGAADPTALTPEERCEWCGGHTLPHSGYNRACQRYIGLVNTGGVPAPEEDWDPKCCGLGPMCWAADECYMADAGELGAPDASNVSAVGGVCSSGEADAGAGQSPAVYYVDRTVACAEGTEWDGQKKQCTLSDDNGEKLCADGTKWKRKQHQCVSATTCGTDDAAATVTDAAATTSSGAHVDDCGVYGRPKKAKKHHESSEKVDTACDCRFYCMGNDVHGWQYHVDQRTCTCLSGLRMKASRTAQSKTRIGFL